MSVIKRFSAFLAVIVLSLSVFSACGSVEQGDFSLFGGDDKESGFDIYSMRDELTARDVAGEMGIGINLGNTFEAYWSDDSNMCGFAQVIGEGKPSNYETCWGAIETTREIIDGMKASGFKTVRIPVFWGNGMADDGTFTVSDDYINRVEEVVKWVLEDGMYCVINMHHYDERLIMFLDREEAVSAAKTVWTQVAKHFKDYGDHLVFEGYNEYLGGVKEGTEQDDSYKFDYCNEMNQVFVDAVRATGGNNADRVLIASGYNTNIDKTTSWRWKLPTDTAENKLMVSVHYVDNNMYWSNQIGSENWYNYSKQQCQLLLEKFTLAGVPVFVGETTANYKDRMSGDSKYGGSEDCIRELIKMVKEEYGFVPVFWDTHGSESFYDRTACKIRLSENEKTVKKYGK